LSARSPAAAVNQLKDALKRALSCISRTALLVSAGGYGEVAPDHRPHTLTLADRTTALGGASRLALSLDHHYRITRVEGSAVYRVTTAAYFYALDDVADPDAIAREILAYHWHPDVRFADGTRIAYPHLHINRGAVRLDIADGVRIASASNLLRTDLAKAHPPDRPRRRGLARDRAVRRRAPTGRLGGRDPRQPRVLPPRANLDLAIAPTAAVPPRDGTASPPAARRSVSSALASLNWLVCRPAYIGARRRARLRGCRPAWRSR
jgi:hypothetical protein